MMDVDELNKIKDLINSVPRGKWYKTHFPPTGYTITAYDGERPISIASLTFGRKNAVKLMTEAPEIIRALIEEIELLKAEHTDKGGK